jgi:hypothetical protein
MRFPGRTLFIRIENGNGSPYDVAPLALLARFAAESLICIPLRISPVLL